MASMSIEEHDDVYYTTDDRSRLSDCRVETDFDKYLIFVIGVNEGDHLFKNLSNILSKDLVRTFEDIHTSFELIRCLQSTNAFVIISNQLAKHLVLDDVTKQRIIGLYVYCISEDMDTKWTIEHKKIRTAVSDSTALLTQLYHDVNQLNGRWSFEEKSFQKALTKESQWYHLFLLVIRHLPKQPQQCYDDMFDECRRYYANNAHMMKQIDDFQSNYDNQNLIHAYTRDSFLYRIINYALRTQNMEIIKKFRPYISDLYSQLCECHRNNCRSNGSLFRSVYRGQYLSSTEFDYLCSIWKSNNPTITLTTFGSTSMDPQVAMEFSFSTSENQISCLFEIIFADAYNLEQNDIFYLTEILFANIASYSSMRTEQEVLFCPGTHFEIKSIEDSVNQSDFPWVFIRLEIVSAADHDSAVNYSNIISRLKMESDPEIYSEILDMLQINADDQMKFQRTNWKNWWNRLKMQWGKNYLSDCDSPLHLTFYNCFTDDVQWSRKAIEINKIKLKAIPSVQSDRSSFSKLFKSYQAWAEVPTIWIALYEDYLKEYCVGNGNTEEVAKCLYFAGNMYERIGDLKSTLECYRSAYLINCNLLNRTIQQIQKAIKKTEKLLEEISTAGKNRRSSDTEKNKAHVTQQGDQWPIYQLIISSTADKSSVQSVLFRVLRYINLREQFYDSYDSKILLSFPHEVTEDLSVNDYYLNFLLALKRHLLTSATTRDAANNYLLSVRRYNTYLCELRNFQALLTFLQPFEMKLEFIRVHLFPQLKRFMKKLTTLVVICFFYICVHQNGDRIDVENRKLVGKINTKAKQPVFFDLHGCDMRVYLEGLKEENSADKKVSITISDAERFVAHSMADFIRDLT